MHSRPIAPVVLATALVLAGAPSCGSSRGSTGGGSSLPAATGPDGDVQSSLPAGSIDAACASEPPTSGLLCSNPDGFCVRPPTDARDGAHCYCKEGRTSCRPVVAQRPSGPCATLVTSTDVLVYEQSVVVGYRCMCSGGPKAYWICNGPPPG